MNNFAASLIGALGTKELLTAILATGAATALFVKIADGVTAVISKLPYLDKIGVVVQAVVELIKEKKIKVNGRFETPEVEALADRILSKL